MPPSLFIRTVAKPASKAEEEEEERGNFWRQKRGGWSLRPYQTESQEGRFLYFVL